MTFVVEGQEVPAHKVLCLRCPYFRALLTGDMRESLMDRIAINDVRKDIFLRLLEYLYTDDVEVDLDMAMELFQAADQFGVDMKRMCESRMLGSIHVENAATIFHAADQHAAASLRARLAFVLANFDAVTRTRPSRRWGGRTRIWCLRSSRRGNRRLLAPSRALGCVLSRASPTRKQGPASYSRATGMRLPEIVSVNGTGVSATIASNAFANDHECASDQESPNLCVKKKSSNCAGKKFRRTAHWCISANKFTIAAQFWLGHRNPKKCSERWRGPWRL